MHCNEVMLLFQHVRGPNSSSQQSNSLVVLARKLAAVKNVFDVRLPASTQTSHLGCQTLNEAVLQQHLDNDTQCAL